MAQFLQPLRRTLTEGAQGAADLARAARSDGRLLVAILLLFAALGGFVTIHLLALAGPALGSESLTALRASPWMMTHERSWPEAWECLLLCGSAVTVALCAWRLRAPVFAALAATQLYLAADNWLSVHERLGGALPLLGQNEGELVVLLASGALLGLATLTALLRTRPSGRALALPLILSLAGVAVCAVVLDAVHAAASGWGWGEWTSLALGFLEDGGEAFFITLGAAISLTVLRLAFRVPILDTGGGLASMRIPHPSR